MQLALILGANPKTLDKGPIVRLPAGTWTVIVHGMNSSVLSLNTTDEQLCELGRITKIGVIVPTDVHIKVKTRGVEDYLTVLAES